eukprot:gene6618-7692_t
MSNAWGKALDQASIVKASFNDLERTAIKATRHKLRIPKEKHVRRPIGDLYMSLLRRLEQPDWIIVLKALVVFHRIFGGGNVRFLEDLTRRGMIFPLVRFTDMTSTQAHQQSVFIRKYSCYLEEKIFAYREMRCEFEKESFSSKGLSIDQLLTRIPKMQRQFDALLGTHVEEVCDNIITINAFELLLKDSFKMYCNLNDAVLNVLELYFNMTKKDATTALEIYKVFMRETNDIIRFFDSSRRKFHIDLPELSPAPSSVVKGLEEYLRDLDDDQPPMGANNNNNGRPTNSNLGSNTGIRPSNTFDQAKRMDDASLINFDEDLFSSAPTPPPNQYSTPQYNSSPQIAPPPNGSAFQKQHQQFQPQMMQQTPPPQQRQASQSSFDPLDPFQITTSQPLSPMIPAGHVNGGRIAMPPMTASGGNPFDPSYNDKALQIKAAFESTSSNNSSNGSSTPLAPSLHQRNQHKLNQHLPNRHPLNQHPLKPLLSKHQHQHLQSQHLQSQHL